MDGRARNDGRQHVATCGCLDPRRGSSTGVIIGVIIVVLLLAIGWYLFLGLGAGQNVTPGDINVDVNLPSLVPASS